MAQCPICPKKTMEYKPPQNMPMPSKKNMLAAILRLGVWVTDKPIANNATT